MLSFILEYFEVFTEVMIAMLQRLLTEILLFEVTEVVYNYSSSRDLQHGNEAFSPVGPRWSKWSSELVKFACLHSSLSTVMNFAVICECANHIINVVIQMLI